MYQTPQPYAPAAPYQSPRPSRPHRRGMFLLLIPVLIIGFVTLVAPNLFASEPHVKLQPGIGAATIDGQDLALVPYQRSGNHGMFGGDMFQVRLSAVDPASGDVRWDTQLSDQLIWEASVLAAGKQYVYVATDSGLAVLDLNDGSIVAQGEGVQGLGSSYIAARAAYGYDAAEHRVLAMNADGDVLAIPLDGLIATRTEGDGGWAGKLSAEKHSFDSPNPTAAKAAMPGGERLELRKRPGGAPGATLVRGGEPVGGTVFHQANLIVEGESAAGAGSGYVLVGHDRTVNDSKPALSAVSLDTGAVTGTVALDSSVHQASTLPGGTTLVVADETLAVLLPGGTLRTLEIGATDFFGNPS